MAETTDEQRKAFLGRGVYYSYLCDRDGCTRPVIVAWMEKDGATRYCSQKCRGMESGDAGKKIGIKKQKEVMAESRDGVLACVAGLQEVK